MEQLLLLNFNGVKYGFALQGGQLTIEGQHFGPGLVSLTPPTRGVDLYANTTTSGSASFSLSAEIFDYLGLRARGLLLHKGNATVYQYTGKETLLSDLPLLYSGILDQLVFNADNNTFAASIAAPEYLADLIFPPAKVGDYLRFPNAKPSQNSLAVPIIYGFCTDVPLIPIDDDATSPVNVRYLVAGHRVASSSIIVVDGDSTVIGGPTYPIVGPIIDGLGGQYSYIEIPLALYQENLYAKELLGKTKDGSTPISNLGDVLEDIWQTYAKDFEIDYTRVTRARTRLNRYTVGIRFDRQESDLSLTAMLESRISGQFPVIFGAVGGQYGWDVGQMPQREDPIQATWSVPEDLLPVSGQTLASTPLRAIRNEFFVEYERSGVAAGDQSGYIVNAENSEVCRASLARWGATPRDRLSLPDVPRLSDAFFGPGAFINDDVSGAWAIATQKARVQGFVRDRISYTLLDMKWLKMPLLSLVRLTDDRFGWVEKLFVVESLTATVAGQVVVRLLSFDSPYDN